MLHNQLLINPVGAKIENPDEDGEVVEQPNRAQNHLGQEIDRADQVQDAGCQFGAHRGRNARIGHKTLNQTDHVWQRKSETRAFGPKPTQKAPSSGYDGASDSFVAKHDAEFTINRSTIKVVGS